MSHHLVEGGGGEAEESQQTFSLPGEAQTKQNHHSEKATDKKKETKSRENILVKMSSIDTVSDSGSFHNEVFSKIGLSSNDKFTEKPEVKKSTSDLEKSGFPDNSDNAICKRRPSDNKLGGESCGKNMYVNNLEYIDLSTPASGRLGHVNQLEYIDASCFSSPALTNSFLGCDDEVSISSVLRDLSSPEMTRFEKQEDKLNGCELPEGGCKLSRVPIGGEEVDLVGGGRDDEVSISSVLSKAPAHQRKESKEAKKSSDDDAKTLKTDGGADEEIKRKGSESALEDRKIATIENLNKWGFLR